MLATARFLRRTIVPLCFAQAAGGGHRPAPPPGRAAAAQLAASGEVQAYIARLEAENRSVGRRNIVLAAALGVGLLVLLIVLVALYQSGVRSYAVLDEVKIERSPASQGRLEIKFQVARPGTVYYRRRSGGVETEVRDYFSQAGPVERSWSWVYEPGEPIDVLVRYRGTVWRRSATARFPTSSSADIVILMDTTGTMHRSIKMLQDRCVDFSEKLAAQDLEHRFALVGFGDTGEEPWLDVHPFTADAQAFQAEVAKLQRFDGGDLKESCLDAIEQALQLPFQPGAMRRFYLVTDAEFKAAQSGATPERLAARLAQEQVMLSVFSRQEYRGQYEPLLAGIGRFQEIEDFGQVLSEGRVLED